MVRGFTPPLIYMAYAMTAGYKYGQKFQKQKKATDPLCTSFLQFIDWYSCVPHKTFFTTFSQAHNPLLLPWRWIAITSVWQLWNSSPQSFEFNEDFLLFVMDSVYDSRFGTFLVENAKEREEEKIKDKVTSLRLPHKGFFTRTAY